MSESDLSARLPGPVTGRPRRPLSNSASTASWSIRFSLLTMISGAPRSSSRLRRLLRLITRRYRSLRSDVAKRRPLRRQVEVAEQVADRLRTHAAPEVDAEAVGGAEAVLELAEDLLVADDLLRLELAEEPPRLLETVDGVDRGVARVLPAGLDVEVHLAHLQRPLDERVEILLLDLPVRPEAEIVRQLADVALGVRVVEDFRKQAVAELPRLLEVLEVDVCDELLVVLDDVATVE